MALRHAPLEFPCQGELHACLIFSVKVTWHMNCLSIKQALYIVQLPRCKEIYLSHLAGWQPFQVLNSCLYKSAIPNIISILFVQHCSPMFL